MRWPTSWTRGEAKDAHVQPDFMKRTIHKRAAKGPVEISTDGKTVWVNDPSGGLIGRLSARGIDVHAMDASHCLDCRNAPQTGAWEAFTSSMQTHHGVTIPKSYRPKWCDQKVSQP